jgi:hypothetical protein
MAYQMECEERGRALPTLRHSLVHAWEGKRTELPNVLQLWLYSAMFYSGGLTDNPLSKYHLYSPNLLMVTFISSR